MKTKKILVLFVALALVLSLVGCGQTATPSPSEAAPATTPPAPPSAAVSQPVENYQQDVISLAADDPKTLDPFNINQSGKDLLWEVYEFLFDTDGFGGAMYPVLADASKGAFHGYDHVAGTPVYTVYLYNNIVDQAGNAVKASDVVFSYNQKIAAGQNRGWQAWGDVAAKDDYTVEFTFKKELNSVGELNNYWARTFIFSEAAYNASADKFASSACGTGRYKLTDYKAGQSIKLTKCDSYWQKDATQIKQQHQANVNEINYLFIAETAQKVINLKSGAINAIPRITTADAAEFKTNDKFTVRAFADNLTTYLLPNCSADSIMGNLDMRLAVFYAVDGKGVAAALGEGSAQQAFTVGNANFPDYQKSWESMDNYETKTDLTVAQQHLTAAGYNGQKLKIVYVSGGSWQNQALSVQAQLDQIGIKSELGGYDFPTLDALQKDPKQWDIMIGGMASNDYIVNVWQHLFDTHNTKDATATSAFVVDPTWQAMLEEVRTEAGHTTEKLTAYHQYMIDHAYAKGLCQEVTNMVYFKGIKELSLTDKRGIIPGGCIYQPVQ